MNLKQLKHLKFAWVLLFVFILCINGFSQSINRIEYFIDSDPGIGNATAVSFTPNDTVANFTFAANTTGLSSGLHVLYVRSKDHNNFWSLTKSLVFMKMGINTPLQNIVQMEYYFDTDPGFGNGLQVSITAASTISNFTFPANTTTVTNGLHTMYIRSKDANGVWSLTNKHSFVKSQINTPTVNIVKAEYFIDVDPGFGSATNIPVTPNSTISNFNFNANVDTIKSGLHTIYIRTQDANGNWSLTNRHTFLRSYVNTPTVNIVKAEYFVDTDPGFGSAINIPVTPNTNITSLNFNANVDTIKSGLHTIYIRTQDANGNWSLTNKHSFVRMANVSPLANIIRAEYFIDSDPGVGNAVNVPITSPSSNIVAFTFPADVTSISNGLHTIYIRTKDANGNWSLTNCHTFYKDQTLANENIVAIEYFIDTDPGIGNGTLVAISPANNISGQSFVANLSSVSTGAHTLYIRSKNQTGDWSLTNAVNFNKAFIAPVSNFVASSTTGCAPFTVNFSDLSQNSPTTWAWDFDNNGSTDATTQNPSYTFNTPGTYSVKLTTSNISGSNTITKTAYITVISNYNVNTSASICNGDSLFLQGQYRKTAGVYNDTLTSTNGCDSIIHTTLTINPLNTPNIIITSNYLTACDNDLITFSSSTSNGGSNPIYQWQVNGNNVGGNFSTIQLSTLNDNDAITCILTSNVSCPATTKDTSSAIVINILPTTTNSITASACNSYTLNSQTYTTGGTYYQVLTNSVGCDSIITLYLTIKNNSYLTKNYTRCFGDTVYEGANAYYATGIYDNYYTAANGCDSIVTVNLQIVSFDNSLSISGGTIFSSEPFVGHQWIDCSTGQAIPGATNYSYSPLVNGSYSVVHTYGSCIDTTGCITFAGIGIKEKVLSSILKIIPNPNTGNFMVLVDELENTHFELSISNTLGQEVAKYKLHGASNILQTGDLSSGIYMITIKTSDKIYTTPLLIEK